MSGCRKMNVFLSRLEFFQITHTYTLPYSFSLLYFLCLEAIRTLLCDTHSLPSSSTAVISSICPSQAPSLSDSLRFSALSFHLLNYAPISLAPQGSSVPVRTLYKDISTRIGPTHTHTRERERDRERENLCNFFTARYVWYYIIISCLNTVVLLWYA